MKKYLIFLLLAIPSQSVFAQNQFKIFIGGGFEDDKITLIGSYYLKDKLIRDTILLNEKITSNPVTGLGKSVFAKYSKGSRYDLTIKINKKTFIYQTDKICKKSELRIENYETISLCFLYEGGFKFY